jgi:hypothetical protein
MNRFGFKSRIVNIENWDHAWVEFFDENNTKYYVDSYVGVITSDFNVFKTKTDWGLWDNPDKFTATYIDGNKIDISSEYFKYLKSN